MPPAALLRLQRMAGNRAVAANLAVQRDLTDEIQSTTEPSPLGGAPGPEEGTKPTTEEEEGHVVLPEEPGIQSTTGPPKGAPGEPAPSSDGGAVDREPLVSGDVASDTALPPESSPADRLLADAFLVAAREGVQRAEDAVAAVVSDVAGMVTATRDRAARELGRLGVLASPMLGRLGDLARRMIGGVRARIASARSTVRRGISVAVAGVRAAATLVREVVSQAHRLVSGARSRVAGAIARLRSLGSGVLGAIGRLLASALAWARDSAGVLLQAGARAGGFLLQRIRRAIESAKSRVGQVVEAVMSRVLAAVIALVERLVAAAQAGAMRIAASIRDAAARAVAAVARVAGPVERRLERNARRAVHELARARARLQARGLKLVRRVGRASRAAAERLVASILEAIGRRAAQVERLVGDTRTGLTAVIQSAVERAQALAGRGEALLGAVESDLGGTLGEAGEAASATAREVSEAASAAAQAATSSLAAGESLLGDLAGTANREAADAQRVIGGARG